MALAYSWPYTRWGVCVFRLVPRERNMRTDLDCAPCAEVWRWAPLGLLAAAAIISLIPSLPPLAHQSAAYLAAGALLVMLVTVIVRAMRFR